jgi:hypothetical protein
MCERKYFKLQSESSKFNTIALIPSYEKEMSILMLTLQEQKIASGMPVFDWENHQTHKLKKLYILLAQI